VRLVWRVSGWFGSTSAIAVASREVPNGASWGDLTTAAPLVASAHSVETTGTRGLLPAVM
jgi:hypothetical protein